MNGSTDKIEGFEVPLHLSLTQPVLLGGVPRAFGILNGTTALVLGLRLHVWWLGFPLGIVLHAVALVLTRHDPDWFEIFRSHIKQPTWLEG